MLRFEVRVEEVKEGQFATWESKKGKKFQNVYVRADNGYKLELACEDFLKPQVGDILIVAIDSYKFKPQFHVIGKMPND